MTSSLRGSISDIPILPLGLLYHSFGIKMNDHPPQRSKHALLLELGGLHTLSEIPQASPATPLLRISNFRRFSGPSVEDGLIKSPRVRRRKRTYRLCSWLAGWLAVLTRLSTAASFTIALSWREAATASRQDIGRMESVESWSVIILCAAPDG